MATTTTPTAADLQRRLDGAKATIESQFNEIKRIRRTENKALQRVDELERVIERITKLRAAEQKIPTWVKPRKRVSKHLATPVLMLSDLHLDEVVDGREMDGLNAYDREIAEARLERTVQKTAEYLKTYTAGVSYDGIVVALLGDIITGAIHEELAKTNEAPVPATIAHWVPLLAAALTYLADELGQVFVPCVDGNHDRTGKRIQFKNRAEESFAWIIYHWLADSLRDDDRITFNISQSPDLLIPVQNTNFLLTHGDSAKGGGGIGGIFPPIIRWVTKKQDSYSARRMQFDYALMGHWHQEVWGPNFIINNSLKGYDEYARGMSFRYSPPSQNLFVVTPERGITLRTSVFAD